MEFDIADLEKTVNKIYVVNNDIFNLIESIKLILTYVFVIALVLCIVWIVKYMFHWLFDFI